MNILITDDEPLARQRLTRMLSELGSHHCMEADSGADAVKQCHQHDFDLVFMDIRMPEMDGLEAAMHISRLNTPPAIIFVTAYDDYALEAFSVNAIDYLLKPIGQLALEKALSKCSKLNQAQLNSLQQETEQPVTRQHITTRVRGDIHLIPIDEILYFQADQKYVTVRHINGQALIEEPLKQLSNEFAQQFIRIHRNALVNRRFIDGLVKPSANQLAVSIKGCDERLEVSRRHASEVRKLIKQL